MSSIIYVIYTVALVTGIVSVLSSDEIFHLTVFLFPSMYMVILVGLSPTTNLTMFVSLFPFSFNCIDKLFIFCLHLLNPVN